ncbi:FAD-dependent oxidoreductase [Actinocorallia populi]|uniref:FAD-dependent oxidoreductase n=1 Tax=Actinocorallia populi TaxID=2079200 RepID=UPI000D088C2C|nr:FAD-dependent oxidoreductase [Actinocorallia populi]
MSAVQDGFDETADVVVVGSGGAALAAAYTAASGGLSTVVLEKTEYFGGTSAYSGAGIWLPGNQVLERAGLPDSVELGKEYFKAVVGNRTPASLQEAFLSTGPELVEFLENDPVLRFQYMPFPDYFEAPGRIEGGRGIYPVPLPSAELGPWLDLLRPPISTDQYGVDQDRETLIGGQALIGRLLLALDATGDASLRTGTRMTSLITEDGRVTGVVVETENGTRRIRAERGVVLAAGGFECDDELRARHHGLPGGRWTSAAPGSNTGDALAALREAGAAVDLMDEAWWCPATLFPNGRAAFTLGLRGGILVNAAGERFANESLPYDRMGHEILRGQSTGTSHIPAWFVFDDRFDNIPAISQPVPDPAAFREAGLWRTAGTLAGLAGLIDVPAEALEKTVERFNGFAESGVDEDFHRGEDPFDRFFAAGEGPNPCLIPLERGPFHAVQIVLGDLGTKGGARIDEDGQVLNESGTPIPGLYAAGNSAASVAGHVYPGPGTPLGSGMVFGYRAARRMVSQERA